MKNNYLLWFANVYNGYVREGFLEKWNEKEFNDMLAMVVKYSEEGGVI